MAELALFRKQPNTSVLSLFWMFLFHLPMEKLLPTMCLDTPNKDFFHFQVYMSFCFTELSLDSLILIFNCAIWKAMKRCFIVRHPFIPHVWVRHGARHEKQKTILAHRECVSLLKETNAQLLNYDDRAMLRNQQEHGNGGTDDTLECGFCGI